MLYLILTFGFLPGDEQEKISPLMRPIMDNLEQLVDSSDRERYSNEQELNDKIQEIFLTEESSRQRL